MPCNNVTKPYFIGIFGRVTFLRVKRPPGLTFLSPGTDHASSMNLRYLSRVLLSLRSKRKHPAVYHECVLRLSSTS